METVNASYRKLSAKYHPDNYVNASEKMQKQIFDIQLKEEEKISEFYSKIDLELSMEPEIIEIANLLQEVDKQLMKF